MKFDAPRVTGLGLATLLLAANAAHAQQMIPDDRSIEIQLFQPAVGPQTFLTVSGADLMSDKRFEAGLGVTYMTGALTVYNVNKNNNLTVRTDVVKQVFGGQLSGAYGYKDKMQFGAALPLIFSMTGQGLMASNAEPQPGGLAVTGLGDLTLEFGYRVFQKEALTLSVNPQVTIPTSTSLGSQDNAFLGDDLPTVRPRASAQWNAPNGKITAGANLGIIIRKPRTIYSSEVGQQFTYGAAGAYHINDKVHVILEVFGRNGFGSSLEASPLEADGALRIELTSSLGIMVGGGAGIIRGMGSPAVRVFAAVNWSPDYRDSDGDGIPNESDKCPFQPEDKDGYMDSDGCIDPDNDNDKIPDNEDKCPNQAEDKDGFEDDDGCPDPDNDKDGLPDDKDSCPDDAEDKIPPFDHDGCPASKRDSDDDGIQDDKDKCPNDVEDKDGFQDADGCPDLDNDQDGIADDADKCPTVAEDKDGFEDADGCAELDNDKDGIADKDDKCPLQPETVNGVNDEDGCPDNGGQNLAHVDGNRVVLGQAMVFEKNGPTIKYASYNMLNQAALVMKSQPDVTKWRVIIAAEKQASDDKTRELSQKRAQEVVSYLAKKGVPAEIIEPVGVVAASPTIAIVALEHKDSGTPPPDNGETVPAPADDGGGGATP